MKTYRIKSDKPINVFDASCFEFDITIENDAKIEFTELPIGSSYLLLSIPALGILFMESHEKLTCQKIGNESKSISDIVEDLRDKMSKSCCGIPFLINIYEKKFANDLVAKKNIDSDLFTIKEIYTNSDNFPVLSIKSKGLEGDNIMNTVIASKTIDNSDGKSLFEAVKDLYDCIRYENISMPDLLSESNIKNFKLKKHKLPTYPIWTEVSFGGTTYSQKHNYTDMQIHILELLGFKRSRFMSNSRMNILYSL